MLRIKGRLVATTSVSNLPVPQLPMRVNPTQAHQNHHQRYEQLRYNLRGVESLKAKLLSTGLTPYVARDQQDEFASVAAHAWIRHNLAKDGTAFNSTLGFHQMYHDAQYNPTSSAVDVGAAQGIQQATEADLLDAVCSLFFSWQDFC